MEYKTLTFEEKKQLLDEMMSETPWVKPEIVDLTLKVKSSLKHCAQKIYGRNLSKMFEAHVVKQMREDGILPPVGTPLVALPDPGENIHPDTTLPLVSGLSPTQPEAPKKKLTRVTLKKK